MRKVTELDIFSLVENDEIECKKAGGGLPKDLWETYFMGRITGEHRAKGERTRQTDSEELVSDYYYNMVKLLEDFYN